MKDAVGVDERQGVAREATRQITPRDRVAEVLDAFDRRPPGCTEREISHQQGMPRATLRYHRARRADIQADPKLVAFLESGSGVKFLHRLLVALHFVFSFVGPCGSRLVALFLAYTELDAFVAGSRESQRQVASAMESAIGEFADKQVPALAKAMPTKTISLAQDETFHPQPCLVAMEPVSGYIVLEKHAEKRDAATWNDAMETALKDLPVKVIQSTGDEAKGLRAHVENGLGAHHSPDLFHVQYEAGRAMRAPLAAQVRKAEAAVVQATTAVERCCDDAQHWLETHHGPGRPPDFEGRVSAAMLQEEQAKTALQDAHAREDRARQARRDIGKHYHPIDISTGAWRSPETVTRELEADFQILHQVARDANLPERAFKGLAKAERVLPGMTQTLVFFDAEVNQRLAALDLAEDDRTYVRETLLPVAYLRKAAAKMQKAEDRALCLDVADARTNGTPNSLAHLPQAQQERVRGVVNDCADLFQRASSCVEGRNGQLALRHHCLHRLTPARLKALTIIHNFVIRQADGTTAAERFFGARHSDLFTWLVEHLPLPSRPARRRSPRPLAAEPLSLAA